MLETRFGFAGRFFAVQTLTGSMNPEALDGKRLASCSRMVAGGHDHSQMPTGTLSDAWEK